MIQVLFVCTGNTCRSPMAEAMLRRLVEEQGLPIDIKSAGVSTSTGIPTSEKSKQALLAKGISFTGKSEPVTERLLEWAHYIFTMTESHKQSILLNHPQFMDKVYTLKQFAWLSEENEALLKQLDQYIAELQTQYQLGQPLDEALRQKAILLESQLPDFDIVDPYGGSQDDYDAAAHEIEQAVLTVFEKFKILLAKRD